MDFKIELIIIGSEILAGHTKDTNIYAFSNFLAKKGLCLSHVQIVSDNEIDLTKALLLAKSRSSVIVASGGLGPTHDDITKSTFSKTFNLNLEKSNEASQVAQKNFDKFERICDFSKNNYDLIPRGSNALNNPRGLAPAIYFAQNMQMFLLVPGVPKEFISIIEESFMQHLEKNVQFPHTKNLVWRTTGVPEEKIFSSLCPDLWSYLENFGTVSSLPYHSGVDIRLKIKSQVSANEIENISRHVQNGPLSPYLWTNKDISIQELILNLLKEKKLSLGLIESCTGGFASHLITSISGSSEYFVGGIIPYQVSAKNNILNISSSITHNTGVNEATACELAIQGRKLLNCDIALSYTGFAGPSGGDKDNPIGRLWMAISSINNKTVAEKVDLIGSRTDLIEKFAFKGLHFLRKFLHQY